MMIQSPEPVHSPIRQEGSSLHRARNERVSEELARARDLELVGAKVAHEVKNALTRVKALVQLGLRNPAEAASHKRLAIIERAVTRMHEILQVYLAPDR